VEGRRDGSTSGSRIIVGKYRNRTQKKKIKNKNHKVNEPHWGKEKCCSEWFLALGSCAAIGYFETGIGFVSRLSNGRDCVSIVIVSPLSDVLVGIVCPSLSTNANVESFEFSFSLSVFVLRVNGTNSVDVLGIGFSFSSVVDLAESVIATDP